MHVFPRARRPFAVCPNVRRMLTSACEDGSWHMHRSAWFGVEVGGEEKRRREEFEWRRSRGGEVKDLGGRLSYGWKLVRLASEADHGAVEGERGYASDGKEVVAVMAHNASLTLTKGCKIEFMGSGLTGVLGERWEIMAVLTAVQLWQRDLQETNVASAA